MALVDTTHLLTNPRYTDELLLRRTTESINQYGEREVLEVEETIRASVFPATSQSLALLPESQRIGGVIEIYYKGAVSLGDVLVWKATRYVVRTIDDYSHFGAGFLKAVATRESIND